MDSWLFWLFSLSPQISLSFALFFAAAPRASALRLLFGKCSALTAAAEAHNGRQGRSQLVKKSDSMSFYLFLFFLRFFLVPPSCALQILYIETYSCCDAVTSHFNDREREEKEEATARASTAVTSASLPLLSLSLISPPTFRSTPLERLRLKASLQVRHILHFSPFAHCESASDRKRERERERELVSSSSPLSRF